MLRHLPRRALCRASLLSRSVTTYRYGADGRVKHEHTEAPLTAPLDPEAAGDATWRTARGVDAYLNSRLASPEYAADPALARGVVRAQEAGMPAIAITPMFGQLMSILVKAMRAERVLEIGTLGGYSTFFFAQALGPRGQIDTIEADEEHARVAQRNLLDLDVFPFPKVYVGYALELLRDPEGPFAAPPGEREGQPKDKCGYDLVFVDANKDQYLEYFLESMRLTRAGGVIVLDNAVRQGRVAVPDDVKPDEDADGLRRVFDWVKQDNGKSVIASTIQTVGDKSWDGFAVIYKK